jgi:cathepsin L
MADTSEQAVLSCSGQGTCGFGYPAHALDWLLLKGTASEADYPYTGVKGTCQSFAPKYKAAAWGYVRPDGVLPTTAELKQALVTHGPIVTFVVMHDQLRGYRCGVFDVPVTDETDFHAVVVVGWDDKADPGGTRPQKDGSTVVHPPKGAWIVRNSWGTGWGTTANYGTERGYMYLAYGSSKIGLQAMWVHAENAAYKVSPNAVPILEGRPKK